VRRFLSGLLENTGLNGTVHNYALRDLPREPCFKFNAVMGFAQASKRMA
jgi:hypothetical protein